MASNIISCLKLMYDAPSCNPRGTMPVLDTEMWVGQEERELGIPDQILDQKLQRGRVKTGKLRQVLLYNFYKKPMANRAPNLASSAAPEGQKIATASQECIRRLKNTSRDLPKHVIERVLMEYMDELIRGGYEIEFSIDEYRFGYFC